MIRHKAGHERLVPAVDPGELHRQQHRRRDRRGPSGRVVYASNRGHDSIAVFAVDRRDGTLTPVSWALTHAKSPRFFCLDPAAKILYAANADEGVGDQRTTDTIVPFGINQANGMLTPTGQVIKTSSPCTIVFASV
jgi:6-phosphogluconolactonase